jgi:hypothetical protein
MKTTLSKKTIEIGFDYCCNKSVDLGNDFSKNLFLSILSDPNSSMMREAITVYASGYEWNSEKLGVDAINNKTKQPIEIKPKLHHKGQCNGGGNFSDYTYDRLYKDYKKNLAIVCSLFSNDKLMYVLEFPFSVLYETLKKQLDQKITVEGNRYCRSASFSWKNYMDSEDIKIHYIDLSLIKKYKCISKNFMKALENLVNPPSTLIKFIK